MSTQNIHFYVKKKTTLNYPKPAVMIFFQGTRERVRNSRGKLAISIRATEGLLYQKVTGHQTNYAFLIMKYNVKNIST